MDPEWAQWGWSGRAAATTQAAVSEVRTDSLETAFSELAYLMGGTLPKAA